MMQPLLFATAILNALTYDQMIQAARSGVANIVEGSEASVTSKKTELKLKNAAKASQEELLFDYQAFCAKEG